MRWELLDRYLAGECDIAESQQVERWAAEAPERRQLLEQLATLDDPDPAAVRSAKAVVWARLGRTIAPGM
ncbi:MAG: hypothetical protein ACR2HK_10595 [Gemmatimonadales bacterium]